MNKKIIKILVVATLCVNIFSINAFATVKEVNTELNGGRTDPSKTNDNTPVNNETTTPSGGGVSYIVGSENYPFKNYRYTPDYCPAVIERFNSFCNNTTNGSLVDTDYRGTDKSWNLDNGVTKFWYEDMYPEVIFEKWTSDKAGETSRTTDYYTWEAVGPANWTVQGSQFQAIYFTLPGKYTVTSIPHQTVTTESWTTKSSKAYDLFSDGHSKLIKNDYSESTHLVTNTPVERTDLKKVWTFTITPEEVNIPVIPDVDPDPITLDDIDWDVELIQ